MWHFSIKAQNVIILIKFCDDIIIDKNLGVAFNQSSTPPVVIYWKNCQVIYIKNKSVCIPGVTCKIHLELKYILYHQEILSFLI